MSNLNDANLHLGHQQNILIISEGARKDKKKSEGEKSTFSYFVNYFFFQFKRRFPFRDSIKQPPMHDAVQQNEPCLIKKTLQKDVLDQTAVHRSAKIQ